MCLPALSFFVEPVSIAVVGFVFVQCHFPRGDVLVSTIAVMSLSEQLLKAASSIVSPILKEIFS